MSHFRVLQINSVVNKGSTGRITENIGKLIQEKGWGSYIAYGQASNVSTSNTYKIGNRLSIYTHALGTRLTDKHGLFSKSETKKLINEIKRINPTIVHLHNIHGYYLNIGVLFNFLSESNIPVVWTLHDCWSFTGHCAYFDYVGCNKWKSQCFDCPSTHSYPASWFVDNSKFNYNKKNNLFNSVKSITLVPVSNWLNNLLKESFLSKYPSKVIHNGIDLDTFSTRVDVSSIRKKYKLTADKRIILGVAGVWEPRKGLLDFIELYKQLDCNYQIVLIGLTAKQIHRLPKGIIGFERTESINELAQLYNLADVFVNPTYEDNFPTTNLEALACGTPVITYNTGGSPEAIDSETGYVVDKGDIQGLAKKIDLVCSKGKAYFREKCRARAEKLYNKDDRYNDYIELYKEILNKR